MISLPWETENRRVEYANAQDMTLMASQWLAGESFGRIAKKMDLSKSGVSLIIRKVGGEIPSHNPEYAVARNLIGIEGMARLKSQLEATKAGRVKHDPSRKGEEVKKQVSHKTKKWRLSVPEVLEIYEAHQRKLRRAQRRGLTQLGHGDLPKLMGRFGLSSGGIGRIVRYFRDGKLRGYDNVPESFVEARKIWLENGGKPSVSPKPKRKPRVAKTPKVKTPTPKPAVDQPASEPVLSVNAKLVDFVREALGDGATVTIRFENGEEIELRQTAYTTILDIAV